MHTVDLRIANPWCGSFEMMFMMDFNGLRPDESPLPERGKTAAPLRLHRWYSWPC